MISPAPKPLLCAAASLAAILCCAAPANAEDTQPATPASEQGQQESPPSFQLPAAPAGASDAPSPGGDEVGFAADALAYDQDADIVTATGNVQMRRDGNSLRADKVVWNRRSGAVVASGNVLTTDAAGNVAYADTLNVTDSLKDGMVDNLLIVLQRGGRLAAAHGTRKDGIYTLDHAAYTGCPVEDEQGCPKQPTWQIRAVKVVYNPDRQRVTYTNATISIFGLPLIPLPGLSHPVGDTGGSGILMPTLRYDRVNGVEIAVPYYWKIAPNRDLTITPHAYSDAAPMLEATFRALEGRGAFQISGYGTYSKSLAASTTMPAAVGNRRFRGYLDASGRFQFDPNWTLTGSIRRATDRTFLRRYDITRDDRLRSNLTLERIGADSYFSLAGWVTQTLRPGEPQGQMPIALPVLDWRMRLPERWLGGTIQLQANSLGIARTAGQDTQRAFASGQWALRRITQWGQEVGLTAYARADAYHSSQNSLTSVLLYRGDRGWRARGIGALAADVKWPLIGEAFGGTQRITPRLQIVAAPRLSNLAVPNEDARAVELEDSNLFALNRFPGYDRFEDSTRITWGLEYRLDRPELTLESVVGQSYRINSRPTLLPNGTGLADRVSDVVGRTVVRYREFVALTHRFRLDKDNLAVRRNEVDATIGSRETYAMIGYLRLNRDVAPTLEDLRDREELRLAGRVQFARYWSVFGSTIIDLTDKAEDPTSVADGYEPVRHRLGVQYSDECLTLGLTWRRDYQTSGDSRRGNSFQLTLAFSNLGI